MSALERRRAARHDVQVKEKQRAVELHKLRLKGFRSVEHKKRFDDRVARNPELTAPFISWNDCKDYHTGGKQRTASSIYQERARNSEILELDYLHELNEVWLADQERAYVEKREDAVHANQNKLGLMKEDFRSRFWTLELECTSQQELRIEQKMLWERMDEDFEEAHASHRVFLRDFDSDFEAELRRFTQVIRRRTEDWIAHCRLHELYSQLCQAEGVTACTRYANELGHQNVSLRNYGLGAASTAVIAKTLANNSFIHTLDLTGNFIGDEGASALAEAIRGGKGMGMLTKSTAAELKPGAGIGGLTMLCSLRDLNVSKNDITSEGARYLLEACCLGKVQSRVSAGLDVSGGGNGGDGGDGGGDGGDGGAPATNIVEILDLSGNRIVDDVSATLEAVLSSHLCGLRKLDLSYNKLGMQSAKAVAEGLRVNRTLVQLSLRWNMLVEGADDIAAACLDNDVIETLDLGFCAVGDVCAARFAEAIEERQAIREEVHSSGGGGGDGGSGEEEEEGDDGRDDDAGEEHVQWIVVDEAKTASLQQLILDHNRISAKGAQPLLAALATNVSLRVIDLAGNAQDIWFGCREEIMTLRHGPGVLEKWHNATANLPYPAVDSSLAALEVAGQKQIGQQMNGARLAADCAGHRAEAAAAELRKRQQAKALEHCIVGLDSGEIVQGKGGTSMLVRVPSATDSHFEKTRFAIAIGGVNKDAMRHESHETELTISVDGAAMGKLRDAIAHICQQDRRRQTREDRKIAARAAQRAEEDNDEAGSGGGGYSGSDGGGTARATLPSTSTAPSISSVNYMVLETWLLKSDNASTEIPHNAFPNDLKIPVLARFTHHVSQNAMLAAQIMGHENPKNVVRVDWPASCLPTGVLLLAYKSSKKLKTRLRRMLRIKRGRRLSMSFAQPAPPARFHCSITRVSTNKGEGSRFCVTNSLEVPFVLPALEENRQVESDHEDDEEDDLGYGAETASDKKKKEKAAKANSSRRTNWVEKMALQKAKREEAAAEDRKRKLAMERRQQGDKSDSDMRGSYGVRDEDSCLETAEETQTESEAGSMEGEWEGGDSDDEDEEEEGQGGGGQGEKPLEARREELPSVLLTWEPSSKITGGRRLVQMIIPMFFFAGLDLDLGATIMVKERMKTSSFASTNE
jgi:hypothetical protein